MEPAFSSSITAARNRLRAVRRLSTEKDGSRPSFAKRPSTGSGSAAKKTSKSQRLDPSDEPSSSRQVIATATPYVDPDDAYARARARFSGRPVRRTSIEEASQLAGGVEQGGQDKETVITTPFVDPAAAVARAQARRQGSASGRPVRRISITEESESVAAEEEEVVDEEVAGMMIKLDSVRDSSHASLKHLRRSSDDTEGTDLTEATSCTECSSSASSSEQHTFSYSSSSASSRRSSSLSSAQEEFQLRWHPQASALSRKLYLLQREAEERENSMVEMAEMLEEQRRAQNRLEAEVKKGWKPKVNSLSSRVFRLQTEAMDRESSMSEMRGALEESQGVQERMGAQIAKLIENEEKAQKSLNYWQEKATSLSKKLYKVEFDLEKREQSVTELLDQRRVQAERIKALEYQLAQFRSEGAEDYNQAAVVPETSSSTTGRKRFSRRASLDKSMAPSLSRAASSADIEEQMREEAKIELVAVEEQLAKNRAEQNELNEELKTMRAFFDASIASSKKKDEVQGKKPKQVYRLSCQKCDTHIDFVGKSSDPDLVSSMEDHFANVWRAVQRRGSSSSCGGGSRRDSVFTEGIAEGCSSRETWSVHFAQHFAKHCRKSKCKTEEEVVRYCRENVKVEVLKRLQAGSELYWDDEEAVSRAEF